MYQVGDYVIYGKSGVCKIKKIETMNFPGMNSNRLYYTLDPVYATETIFAPVDTQTFMRSVITKQEALQLIDQIPSFEDHLDVPPHMNAKQLPEFYDSLLKTHDCKDMIRLIMIVDSKRKEAIKQNRKLSQVDQNFLKDAENALYGELALALSIDLQNVPEYIAKAIAKKKRETN